MATDKKPDVPEVAQPDHHFTVIHPFGDYRRGDLITNPAEIDSIMAGENAHHCRKVTPQ